MILAKIKAANNAFGMYLKAGGKNNNAEITTDAMNRLPKVLLRCTAVLEKRPVTGYAEKKDPMIFAMPTDRISGAVSILYPFLVKVTVSLWGWNEKDGMSTGMRLARIFSTRLKLQCENFE